MEDYHMDMDEEHTITLNLASSPDPLLDPILSPPMLPPSRVKKMPQPAAQLLSIARSPRKQMFELDIGNEQSPQRLFVTVEAGENPGTIPNNNRNIKRRLFQSPTPTPSRRAMSQIKNNAVTTTTVPLHGLTDDEGVTPKKRGRPRKSGTPVQTRRKRQGTPGKVGRPPRRASASPHKDFPTSDLGFEDVDATPRARPVAQPSPRKSTKRKTMSPTKGDGATDGQPPRKRGRPRKSEVTASIAEMLAEANAAETRAQNNVPKEQPEEPEPELPTERHQPAPIASGDQGGGGDDFEDDIWLNTLSGQPAQPMDYDWGQTIPTSPSPRRPAQQEPAPAPTSDSHFNDGEEWAEMHDDPADDYSEAGSVRSQSHDRQDGQDTVMANEDFTNFTRISISELPSMQMNSSVMSHHQQQQEDLGEETSLIIERTMDYLRQSRNRTTVEIPEPIPEEVSHPKLPAAERRAQTRFQPSDGADELAGQDEGDRFGRQEEQHVDGHDEQHAENHDDQHFEDRDERHYEEEVEEHVEDRFGRPREQNFDENIGRHDEEEIREHIEDRFDEREEYVEEVVHDRFGRRQERADHQFQRREEVVQEDVQDRFGRGQESTEDQVEGGEEHFEEQVEEYGEDNHNDHVDDHNDEYFEGHGQEYAENEQRQHDDQRLEGHNGRHFKHNPEDHIEAHEENHFKNYNDSRFEEHGENVVEDQVETHINQNRRETPQDTQTAQRARISPPTTFQPPQEEPPQASPGAWWNQAPKRPKRKKPISKTLGLKRLIDEANAREAEQGQGGPSNFQEPDVSGYDDSFSTIPDSVLIAATPRKPLQLPVENEEAEQEDAQEDEIPSEQIQPSIERQSTVNPSIPQSETNRLLTPDETSSPVPPEDGEMQQEPQLSGPALEIEMPSSPPISNPSPPPQQQQHPTNSFSSHMRSNSTETPADQLSSFKSTSTAVFNAQQQAVPQPSLTLPEPVHRPSLSPIVRAGQRLQQVTSDPPSPPARDKALGSPFRKSVTKSSQSPAQFNAPARTAQSLNTRAAPEEEEQRSWSDSLGRVKDIVSNAVRAISPRRRGPIPNTDNPEDPFGPDPVETSRSGESRKTLFSPVEQMVDRDATISATGSPKAASIRDDDAMSWQGESSPVREPVVEEQEFASPTSSVFAAHGSFLSSREPEEPEQNSSVFATHGSFLDQQRPEDARNDRFIGIVPEPTPISLGVAAARAQAQQQLQEEEDDEEDFFLLEAQRPTPFAVKYAPLQEQTNIDPPRMKTIISTTDRLERLDRRSHLQNDENRRLRESAPANQDDEMSLLSQINENRAPASSRSAPAPATARKQPAFADFFSPMATLPPNSQNAPGVGVFPTAEGQRGERTRTERPVSRSTAAVRRLQPSSNSLFPKYTPAEPVAKPQPIPQKKLEIGNRRPSVDLFSPKRKPAEVPKPVEPMPIKEVSRSHTEPKQDEEGDEEEEAEKDLPVPAAQNPPSRRNSLFGAIHSIPKLFSYQRAKPAEQPETQQVQRQQKYSHPSHEVHEEDYLEASELHSSPPRPRPRHRAASPSKSCIRSPEKGKTPGRVVEFTSSTLSPLAQAERRAASKQAAVQPPKQPEPIRASKKASAPAEPLPFVELPTQSEQQIKRQTQRRVPPVVEKAPQSPVQVPPPSTLPKQQPPRRPAPATKTPAPAPIPKPPQSCPAPPKPSSALDKPLPPLPPPSPETEHHRSFQPVQSVQPDKLPSPLNNNQEWTTPHWELLSYLVTLHRANQLPHHAPPEVSKPMLGKIIGKINSQTGEDAKYIVLEQWHVDVIFSFQRELSQSREKWEDMMDLGKRLFALLLGEQRRQEGKIDRGRRLKDGRYPEDLV